MQKIETLRNKSGESIYPLTSTKAVVDENGNTIEHRLVVADGEDLVTDGNVLRLKDRPSTDGMGYVILRKNKTFQEQVTKPNTIYEIRYDFDLGRRELPVVLDTPFVLPSTGGAYYRTGDHINVEAGMTIDLPSGGVLFDSTLSAIIPAPYTPSSKKSLYVGKLQSEAALGQSCVYSLHKEVVIPENCVLKFEGGSLGNGTVVGFNTLIKSDSYIFKDIHLAGQFVVNTILVDWFKPVYQNDISDALQQALDMTLLSANPDSHLDRRTVKVTMSSGIYTISKTVTCNLNVDNPNSEASKTGLFLDFNNSAIVADCPLLFDFFLSYFRCENGVIRNSKNSIKYDRRAFRVCSNNIGNGLWLFKNMSFSTLFTAIDTVSFKKSRSMLMNIENCYFTQCVKPIISWVDMFNLYGCFFTQAPIEYDINSPNYNNNTASIECRGNSNIVNCMFIPSGVAPSIENRDLTENRWIDYGKKDIDDSGNEVEAETLAFSARGCRFSGERGCIPALFTWSKYTQSSNNQATVSFSDCFFGIRDGRYNTAIVAKKMPRSITVDNCILGNALATATEEVGRELLPSFIYLQDDDIPSYKHEGSDNLYKFVLRNVQWNYRNGSIMFTSENAKPYVIEETNHTMHGLINNLGNNRPKNPRVGQYFFDTTLGMPIWWTGAAWVDALGRLAGDTYNEVRHNINGTEIKVISTDAESQGLSIYAPTELENDGYVVAQQDNKAKFVDPADIGLK